MKPRLPAGTQMDGATARALAKLRKIYTAKGSIVSATGAAAPVELVVGANSTVLTADSTTVSGLKWATISGGGGGDMLVANNLSELTATAATARTNLGLGSAATTASTAYATAAQGTTADAALKPANNLSDVALAATARTNLGLGTAATTASTAYATAAQGTTADAALKPANNLSDVGLAATARTNLGLGTAATTAATAYATAAQGTTADAALKPANNLSDVSVVATARTNLGLGSAATTASTAYATSTQGTTADNAIPKATVTAKGTVVTGTAASTPSGLLVGANGTFLKADSTTATGLVWSTIPGGGDLLAANNLSELTATAGTARTNLGLGSAATTASTAYATAAQGTTADGAVPKSLYTAKGMIDVATAASTPSGLAVGGNNTMLVADSAAATGVKWANIVDANITTGTITLARLASGTSAQHPVCNISGVPVYVTMSGDITQTNAGVTAIGAGKVTNAMLATATSGEAGGVWVAYTPTVAGFTNATATGKWMRQGKTAHFYLDITFSGATVVTGTPTVTIPTAKLSAISAADQVHLSFMTAAGVHWSGGRTRWSTTSAFFLEYAFCNSNAGQVNVTPTAALPFTFASGAHIYASGTYETA